MSSQQGHSASSEFERAADTVKDIQRDLQAVRDDLARLAQQISALVAAGGSDAVGELKAQLNRVRDTLEDAMARAGGRSLDVVRDTTDTMLEALEASVRNRPVATLGIALGLGFLFGATWRR
jgi:ElaB/YqjD/DUF883 family membrane-anchored ribosome-binding protein